ncbi:peptidoglycan-binding protein [Pseudahrensia aquimaris]|uniref:Peptidoglycan-binding protein n=1 Tax=Pseudahrensia aquimaris TaxID=744461 RepID=A0ABW3FFF9_9HYPH
MREAFPGHSNDGPTNTNKGSESARIAKLRSAIEEIEQRIANNAGGSISSEELRDMQQQLNRLSKQVTAAPAPKAATPTRPVARAIPIAPRVQVKPPQPQSPTANDIAALALQQDQALEVISRQFDVLKAEIATLKKDVAKPVTVQSKIGQDEIQRIARSLSGMNPTPNNDDVVDRFSNELESLRARIHEDMQREMRTTKQINERLDTLAEGVETLAVNSSNAVMPRVDDLSAQIDNMRVSIEDLPQTLSITSMEKRLNTIADQIDQITQAAPGQDMSSVEKRLDEIARALVAVSNMSARGHEDPEAMRRLEERFDGLDQAVQALAHNGSTPLESAQIAELANRIETLTDRLGSFEKYAENGDIGAASALFAGPDTSALEAQLAQLTARLDEASQVNSSAAQLSNLEAQVGKILRQMNKQTETAIVDFTPVEARLGQLESKLDTSTQFSVEAAQQAAQQAVSMLGANSDQGQAIAALSQELRALQTISQAAPDNTQSFDDMRDMLGSIADRLGQIENTLATSKADAQLNHTGPLAMPRAPQYDPEPQMAQGATAAVSAAQAVRHEAQVEPAHSPAHSYEFAPVVPQPTSTAAVAAPSLDPTNDLDNTMGFDSNEHMPIEPEARQSSALPDGIGSDDLNDMVERAAAKLDVAKASYNSAKASYGSGADNIKPDPIGAARRALQATTDEMNAARSEAEGNVEGLTDDQRKSSLLARLSTLNIRKPLIVAAAAAILLIAASTGYKALTVEGDSEVANVSAPVVEQTLVEDAVQEEAAAENEVADEPQTVAEAPANAESSDQPSALSPPEAVPAETSEQVSEQVPETTPNEVDSATLETEQPAVEDETVASVAEADETAGQQTEETMKFADVADNVGPEPFVAAARQGDPKALFELAMRYSDGKIVPRDLSQSAIWFERAAEAGFAPAQYSVGSLYEKGIGVEKNIEKAAQWYALAADQGNARAMHNLAVINAMGVGGNEANMEVAVNWFKKAAEFGIKDSQFNLGILYGQGMGVPQNLSESYKWFGIAAKTGDADAASKRDEVAKAMDSADLAQMKEVVANWKGSKPDDATNRVAVPQEWRGASKSSSNSIEMLIKKTQISLNERGFKVGEPDGLIGPKTKRAIMEFQRAAGLPITGKVDRPLVAALGVKG